MGRRRSGVSTLKRSHVPGRRGWSSRVRLDLPELEPPLRTTTVGTMPSITRYPGERTELPRRGRSREAGSWTHAAAY